MSVSAKNSVVAWIDTETTGLDKEKCAILSLAIIITNNLEIIDKKEFRFKPTKEDRIDEKALQVNGFTREEIAKFPNFSTEIKKVKSFLAKYLPLCEKQSGKYYIGGQNNIEFDTPFIKTWIKRHGGELNFDDFFYIENQIDTKYIAKTFGNLIWKKERPYNTKLTTMSEFYGFDTTLAHTAMDDTERTIEVYKKMLEDYFKNVK